MRSGFLPSGESFLGGGTDLALPATGFLLSTNDLRRSVAAPLEAGGGLLDAGSDFLPAAGGAAPGGKASGGGGGGRTSRRSCLDKRLVSSSYF